MKILFFLILSMQVVHSADLDLNLVPLWEDLLCSHSLEENYQGNWVIAFKLAQNNIKVGYITHFPKSLKLEINDDPALFFVNCDPQILAGRTFSNYCFPKDLALVLNSTPEEFTETLIKAGYRIKSYQ